MQNKKGLSEIVATLIIILLTLVAVGIIWVVIRGVVTSGTNQIDISSKCTAVSLDAVSVNETSPGIYAVTLHRAAGGDVLGGEKITIFNSTGNSGVLDFGAALVPLQTLTKSVNTSVGTNTSSGNSMEFTPYFIDSSGNQQPCSQTQTFSF